MWLPPSFPLEPYTILTNTLQRSSIRCHRNENLRIPGDGVQTARLLVLKQFWFAFQQCQNFTGSAFCQCDRQKKGAIGEAGLRPGCVLEASL